MGDMNPETPETQQHVSQRRELQEEKASPSEMRKTEAKENTQRGEIEYITLFCFSIICKTEL